MKVKLTSLLLLVFAIFSCSDSENDQTNEFQQIKELNQEENAQLDLGKGLESAFENLNIDFGKPVTYTYSTSSERDLIIESIIRDVYEVDLHSNVNAHGQIISDEFSVNIVVSEWTKTIVLYPEPVNPVVVSNQTYGDNEDCGGKAGDGWKSYGTCMSKKCVEDKSKDAAADLSSSLTSGKCLDIRVKRNAINARVCGRVIDC